MSMELIINASLPETRIAQMENGQIQDLLIERTAEKGITGNIYKGKVTRVLPGMQAAFVDIGLEKAAFLYVDDVYVHTSFSDPDEAVDEPLDETQEESEVGTESTDPSDEGEAKIIRPKVVITAHKEKSANALQGRVAAEGSESTNGDENDETVLENSQKNQSQNEDSRFTSDTMEVEYSESEGALDSGDDADEVDSMSSEASDDLVDEQSEEDSDIDSVEDEVKEMPFAGHSDDLDDADGVDVDVDVDVKDAIVISALTHNDSEQSEADAGSLDEQPSEGAPSDDSDGEGGKKRGRRGRRGGRNRKRPLRSNYTLVLPGQSPKRFENNAADSEENAATGSENGAETPSNENYLPDMAGRPTIPEGGELLIGERPEIEALHNRHSEIITPLAQRKAETGVNYDQKSRPEFKEQKGRDRRVRSKPSNRVSRAPVNIQDLLKEGQEVLVQVSKDPISTKGARLTCHISLPGRHLVCMPTIDHVGVSRRIERDDERRKLRELVEKNRPKKLGFIVRTASGRSQSEKRVKQDIDYLSRLWKEIRSKAAQVSAPALVYEDLNAVLRAIRDWVTEDIDKVIVDSRFHYNEICRFVSHFMPSLRSKVELYHGDIPIFDAYSISTELSRALERKVWLKSGGSIVIDQAEALVAIDVNTGRFVGKKNLEDTILKTNLEAVQEVAYQLRLRNCGGIIIIDLIDMEKEENKLRVYRALEDALKRDRARPSILKISELGLIEMTRKRTRDTIIRTLCESCSHCEGKGFIKSRQTVGYEVLREIEREGIDRDVTKVLVQANADVIDFLAIEQRETIDQIERRYRKSVYLQTVGDFHPEQFEVIGEKKDRVQGERSERQRPQQRNTRAVISPVGQVASQVQNEDSEDSAQGAYSSREGVSVPYAASKGDGNEGNLDGAQTSDELSEHSGASTEGESGSGFESRRGRNNRRQRNSRGGRNGRDRHAPADRVPDNDRHLKPKKPPIVFASSSAQSVVAGETGNEEGNSSGVRITPNSVRGPNPLPIVRVNGPSAGPNVSDDNLDDDSQAAFLAKKGDLNRSNDSMISVSRVDDSDDMSEEDRLAFLRAQAAQDAAIAGMASGANGNLSNNRGGMSGGGRGGHAGNKNGGRWNRNRPRRGGGGSGRSNGQGGQGHRNANAGGGRFVPRGEGRPAPILPDDSSEG